MTTSASPWFARPYLIEEAARKATWLFPGVIGEVLSREIVSLHEFTWLGEGSRPARLLMAVADLDEPEEGNTMGRRLNDA